MERSCRLDKRGYRGGQKHERRCRCRSGCRRWGKVRSGRETRDISRACTRRRLLSPSNNIFRPRSTLPVYRRQLFPDRLLSERAQYGVQYSRRTRCGCGIPLASRWQGSESMKTVSPFSASRARCIRSASDVLDGVQQAIDEAERNWRALGDLADGTTIFCRRQSSKSHRAPEKQRAAFSLQPAGKKTQENGPVRGTQGGAQASILPMP